MGPQCTGKDRASQASRFGQLGYDDDDNSPNLQNRLTCVARPITVVDGRDVRQNDGLDETFPMTYGTAVYLNYVTRSRTARGKGEADGRAPRHLKGLVEPVSLTYGTSV